MRAKILAACLLALTPLGGADAAAQEDDLANRIISVPNPRAYRVDGVRTGARVRADARVQGGHALRVPVSGRGANAYQVAIAVPITRAVAAGDQLVLAFWARIEEGEAATATLPARVQLSASPYTGVIEGSVTVGPEWQMHELRGRADRDYAANSLNVAIHLATGRQVIDIGPVFVLNMGPGGQ